MEDAHVKRRVLLAADDHEIREAIARVLTGAGFSVEAMADGEDALGRVSTESLDLLVVDMPPEGGGRRIGVARVARRAPSLPILLLGSPTTPRDEAASPLPRNVAVLTKPVTAQELLKAVIGLLRDTAVNPAETEVALFERLLPAAAAALGASHISLMRVQPTGATVQAVASYPPRPAAPAPCDKKECACWWAIAHGEPLVLMSTVPAPGNPRLEQCPVERPPAVYAPVKGAEATYGCLQVCMPGIPSFGDAQPRLEMVRVLAQTAAALLQAQDLRQKAISLGEQLGRMVQLVVEAQERERERVCLEVHDGVAQTLVSAVQHLQALDHLSPASGEAERLMGRAVGLVRQALRESRDVINSLQPPTLKEQGLLPALRQEARKFEAETGRRVRLVASHVDLSEAAAISLYRIVHEALNNIGKHSSSSRAQIRVEQEADTVRLEIRDWGKGFDVEKALQNDDEHKGLFSMRKRAQLLGGELRIESRPLQGTRILVTIPRGAATGAAPADAGGHEGL